MITLKIGGYLSLRRAKELQVKYPSMLIQSNEDFNGQTIYSYVEMAHFRDDDEAMLFMIEASDCHPEVTTKPFKAGHKSF